MTVNMENFLLMSSQLRLSSLCNRDNIEFLTDALKGHGSYSKTLKLVYV